MYMHVRRRSETKQGKTRQASDKYRTITRQDKTQDTHKTRQDKTRQDKTRQDKAKEKTRQRPRTRQHMTHTDNTLFVNFVSIYAQVLDKHHEDIALLHDRHHSFMHKTREGGRGGVGVRI